MSGPITFLFWLRFKVRLRVNRLQCFLHFMGYFIWIIKTSEKYQKIVKITGIFKIIHDIIEDAVFQPGSLGFVLYRDFSVEYIELMLFKNPSYFPGVCRLLKINLRLIYSLSLFLFVKINTWNLSAKFLITRFLLVEIFWNDSPTILRISLESW